MAEPELSMLWERADAVTALRERFGLADATIAAMRVSETLARHWGIRVTACERIVLSDQNLLAWVHTPTGPLVAKACGWQPLFACLGAIAEVVAQLGAQGLPVAAPRRTLDGAARAVTDDAPALSVTVLPEVTGDFLDAGDPAAVRASGVTLARVHLALAQLEIQLPEQPESAPASGADPRLLFAEATAGRKRAPRAAARLDALLADLPDLDVAAALVHGDVRGANVLVDRGQVTALLDYDSVMLGHRVLDVAAGAVKLATRFRSWDPPPPGARDHLLAGYCSVAPLTPAEEQWFEAGVLARSLGQIPKGADPAGWAAAVDGGFEPNPRPPQAIPRSTVCYGDAVPQSRRLSGRYLVLRMGVSQAGLRTPRAAQSPASPMLARWEGFGDARHERGADEADDCSDNGACGLVNATT